MLFEVSKEQFETACKGLASDAVIHASFTIVEKATIRRSISEPPKGSAPGTTSETRLFDEDVPEHTGRILILTPGGEMVFQPTERFEPDFVRKLLPKAVVVGSIHG